jgi:hypothetical protein
MVQLMVLGFQYLTSELKSAIYILKTKISDLKDNSMNYISFLYNNKTPIFIWKISNEHVVKGNEIVEESDELRLLIDFPLKLPKLFIYSKKLTYGLEEKSDGWTRNEVLNIISRTYKNIYREEMKTATLGSDTTRQRSVSDGCFSPRESAISTPAIAPAIRRAETNGIHHIHTYNLSDLYITEIIFDFKKDYWRVGVSGKN